MKVLDIALKDLLRSFRSAFALVFMFVMPLLTAGVIYFAFGGLSGGEGGFDVPVTSVRVVNLDQPPPQFAFSAGEMLADFLESEELSNLLAVTTAPDEIGARAAVDRQEADVAVIIPVDFTAAAFDQEGQTAVTLYHDPTLTLGPAIVKGIVGQFVDSFGGASIATAVAAAQGSEHGIAYDRVALEEVATRYSTWAQNLGEALSGGESPLVELRQPPGGGQQGNEMAAMMARIVIAMAIFYAFFTGASAAQSILTEDEEGTLPRLFTTPTPRSMILGGKFLAIFLMVMVQVIVTLMAGAIIFDIRWGNWLPVAGAVVALVVSAAGFGLFLISFLKNSRQAGIVMGGVLTVTGMAGGLMTSGFPNPPGFIKTLSLVVPQGWSLRGWIQVLEHSAHSDLLLSLLVTTAIGVILFAVGALVFRRRYA
jgi:ABC-2 type transport system permease protein